MLYSKLGVVVHACDPSTVEAKTEEWRVQAQPGLYSEILSPKRQISYTI
jgi:hypothetical protein